MSQENLDNLRAVLNGWSGENLRAFPQAWRRGEVDMSIYAADVTYEDVTLPDHVRETYRGHEGIVRATERWTEPYEDLTIELERILEAGNRIVSIHRVRARAQHTHLRFDSGVGYLWTFQDAKVIHVRSSPAEEALHAVGLEE